MKSFVICAVAASALLCAGHASAIVNVTAATGGTSLSSDNAQNGSTPTFTTLGNIVIVEGAKADFADTGGTAKTLILTAPTGWRFNAGVGTVTFDNNNITAASISVSATTITVSVTVSGGNKTDTLTISGIQAQAIDGGNLPATGNILRTSANPGTATIAGITNGSTNFGTLSQAIGALRMYVVLPGQTFVDGATLAASGITGSATAQAAGTSFALVKLVVADRQFNIDSAYAGAKTINYSGAAGSPSFTTAVSFSAGQSTTTLTTTLTKAETITITATDGTVTGVASSSLTVNAGTVVKLQLLVPGETATPGVGGGKTGTPNTQSAGVAFNVAVRAVDANWNLVGTISDTVQISSSDFAATLPGAAALVAGTNSFSVTFHTDGSQTLTATDLTNGSITSSTSPSITVNKTPTTTLATSSLNPSIFGQVLTFTATVTQVTGSITPTGMVTFKDGAVTLGTETLDGAGSAAFTIVPLPAGNHPISAVYGGDGNYNTSTSATFTQVVSKVGTSTTLESSPNPSALGESVTFTATVTADEAGAGNGSGTVTLKDGVTTLGTVTLFGGQAIFATAALSGGSHTNITATYNGDANFLGSISAAFTQNVSQATSTTTVISSASPSVFGQPVTFTATVSVSGTPTGNVTFNFDGAPLTNITLNVSGQAILLNSSLSVGEHTITATYNGDLNFTGSTSGDLTQNVNQAATTTAVGSSLNPSAFGQSVTLTGTVSVVSPGAGTRTGTMTFNVDGVDQTPVSINASGQGLFSTAGLSITNHTITATYSGDGNFTGSASAIFTQTVNKAISATVVTSSINPSVFGQSVTFTATVSGVVGTPTGTVIFRDGATPLATNALSAGQATLNTSSLTVGPHSITAVYSGDSVYNTNTSAVLTQTVNRDSTTTTVGSSLNPSVFGQSVTFTATVVAAPPGAGTPTGSVIFQDGATPIGTNSLIAGQTTLNTTALAAGSRLITAVYTGDANFTNSASAILTQTVSKADTTAAVVSSVNPSVFGQPVIFTATVNSVAPGSGTPTGTVSFKDGATTLATSTLTAGQVAYTNSTFVTGNRLITVVYNGSGNFNTSTSAILTQVVNQANTTTSLASSANPSVFGQSVTFTATVSPVAPGAGTRTGTVSFSLDGGPVTNIAVNASGLATIASAALSVGGHTVAATYNGDANFAGSTATNLAQTVNQAATTTATSSSLNPSVFGQSVTFTGTVSVVSPGAGTRTGTMTFNVDGANQAPVSINAAGIGTLLVSGLSTGNHVVVSTYSGDVNFAGSTSANLTQVVNRASSAPLLVSSVNPSLLGQSVTFTATVTSPSGTPTGTVIFQDGATPLATNALSAGQATFITSTLTVSNHTISAVFSGDENFAGSNSTNLTQVVKADTTTELISSVNPACFGQSVIFTMTVAAVGAGAPTPIGTVTLRDGATPLATNTLVSGQTTFSISSLAVSNHLITATYNGGANFNSSTSVVLTQTVNKADTLTTVTSSANPSAFGQSVTFTATVSTASCGAGTRTGTVTFSIDGTPQTPVAVNASGQATLATSVLSVSAHTITATYSGDGNFNTSTSADFTQTVNRAGTTTVIGSSFNPAVFGQSVTLTATVSAVSPGAGTRTGTVTFNIDGANQSPASVNASGQATFNTSSLSVSNHTIQATYNGDGNFASSISTNFSQVVNKANTSTSLNSSVNPSTWGQSVTFTATVTTTAPGAGTPTGSVIFKDGAIALATNALSTGQAILSTAALAPGSHSITAVYLGDASYQSSTNSPALNQNVTQTGTTTLLNSSVNPTVFGQSVTFTATVSAATGTPTGSVIFKDGPTSLITNALSGGVAMLTTSSLSVSNHLMTAVYTGDGNFTNSTSAVLTQTVAKATTSAVLISSANPSVFGQSVVFTSTVSAVAPGAGTPTGTVVFKDGATTLGSNTLAGGQTTFATAALSTGNHTNITATYNGDANFNTTISSAFTQLVNNAETTTAVGSSVNPSVVGQSVTLTVTVSPVAPGAGTRTGTVTFAINGAPQTPATVNAAGQATFTTASWNVGSNLVVATYSGDSNFNGSASSTFTQIVNKASTTTSVSSSLNPSAFGQSVTFTGTVSVVSPGAGTRTGTLTFSVDGVPQTPVSINASGLGTFSTASLTATNHLVSALYDGDGNFNTSTSTNFTQVVNKASTTTTVSSSLNPTVFGQSVTFTATVAGSIGTPTGTVTFKDGATTLGSGALDGLGQTTFATAALSVSNHVISAVYAASENYSGSTSTNITQIVNKSGTTTVLISATEPACFGQPVLFTATVSPAAPGTGLPTGSVIFRDGTTPLVTNSLSSGQATFSTSTLSAGTHSLTAIYTGNTSFNVSTNAPALTQTVNALPVCLINGVSAICSNSTAINFTAPVGMSAYNWSITGNGLIVGATNGPSVNVDGNGGGSFTLTLMLTDTNGCSSTCNKIVTVNTPPTVTGNPTNRVVCVGNTASFTASASGSPVPTVRWQASTDNGATFTNIPGATSSTYAFTATTSQNGNQYRATFTNSCGSAVTTAAILTVTPVPIATITADDVICAASTGNMASVPDAGEGATYSWTISGGTITAGAGTSNITYSANFSSVTLNVTVTRAGCSATGSKIVSIGSASKVIQGWRNKLPLQWQTSTFNDGDHKYSDGNSIPYRVSLNQLCGGSAWCVVLQYDFKDGNTARHFYDFLTTYNASESTVAGQECAGHACDGAPTTYPIPSDPELTYQLPGMFTVYGGTITNASVYTTISGSTLRKELTISGTTAPGTAVKDVLILFGGHFARDNEWGNGNGARSFPGASAKISYKLCGESSFSHLSLNPSSLVPQADLSITKTGAPNPVCLGGVLTYSVIVSNNGPNQATSVTVQDVLPAKTSFVSATPSQGTFTGTTNLNFALGSINAGTNASISIVVNVSPTATGSITNTATVTAVAPTDPFSANNSATAITNLRTPPSCLISGPSAVCPAATTNFTGPAGMTTYGWTITGNGAIVGATNAASVTVTAGVSNSFTLGLSVTDTNGCVSISACQKPVTIENAGAPLLICPDDRQLQCGQSTDPSNTGTATANADCGGGSATVGYVDVVTPAGCAGVAGIDRIWTATNVGGGSSVCTQHITFVDSTPPLIGCPANQLLDTDPGSCMASNVNLGTPVVSDNCTGVTVTNNAPAVFATGTTLVIWTATDACGNSATCTQTVTVADHQPPTIVCPSDIVTNTDFSGCAIVGLDLDSPVVEDNCGVTSLTNNAPFAFPVGTTLVIWTAGDANGNQGICTQQVVVIRDPPVLCYIVRDYNAITSFSGCIPESGTGENLWSGKVTFNGDQWDTQGERTSFLGTGGMQMDQDVVLFYDGCVRRLVLFYTNPDDQTYENILWSGLETGVGSDVYDRIDGCAAAPQVILDVCDAGPCFDISINFTNTLAISCAETVNYCGTAQNTCTDCVFSTTGLEPTNLILTTDGCITGRVGCAASGTFTNIITVTCGAVSTNINLIIELSCPQDPPIFAGLQIATPFIEAATLGWEPANVSDVNYLVYLATTSGTENFSTPLLITTNLTALISPLEPGTSSPITYYFIVRALDACGIADTNTVELLVHPLLDPNKDQDGDGMLNGFEEQFGFNPFDPNDAASDFDGDGLSNLDEALAGTDPTNAASAFAITGVVRLASDIRITWNTGLGRTNALQRAAGSFGSNLFTDVFAVTNATGSTTNYLDLGAATNSLPYFYRIHLVP